MPPQVGIVRFDNNTEYEFGLNIAMVFDFALSDRDELSNNIGSGPHYITARLDIQASGYLFSNNLNLKSNELEAWITAGIRHISALCFEDPNISVETILVGFTLAKTFN